MAPEWFYRHKPIEDLREELPVNTSGKMAEGDIKELVDYYDGMIRYEDRQDQLALN